MVQGPVLRHHPLAGQCRRLPPHRLVRQPRLCSRWKDPRAHRHEERLKKQKTPFPSGKSVFCFYLTVYCIRPDQPKPLQQDSAANRQNSERHRSSSCFSLTQQTCKKRKTPHKLCSVFLVENSGIEPLTSCMPCKRSPEPRTHAPPHKGARMNNIRCKNVKIEEITSVFPLERLL